MGITFIGEKIIWIELNYLLLKTQSHCTARRYGINNPDSQFGWSVSFKRDNSAQLQATIRIVLVIDETDFWRVWVFYFATFKKKRKKKKEVRKSEHNLCNLKKFKKKKG